MPAATADLYNRIQREHIRTLFRQTPAAIVAHTIDGSLLVGLTWASADRWKLSLWLSLLVLLGAARAVAVRVHARLDPPAGAWRTWARVHTAFSGAYALCWAAAAVLFLDPSHPVGFILLPVIVMGLSAGAATTQASHPPAFFAFTGVASMGVVAVLMLAGEPAGYAVAFLTFFMFVGTGFTCLNIHRVLDRSLHLGFENLALRHEAEEKSALLETTLQSMNQGISVTEPDGRLRMWNQPFLAMLGIGPIPEKADLSDALASADPPVETLQGDRFEYRRGRDKVIEIRTGAMPDGGEVWTYTDISEIKERERALEKARIEAERANAAKTQFLAAASHDLRQPIHALGLFFSALAEKVQGEETRLLVAQVERTITVISSMLNALLDMSKLDAGVVKPDIGVVELDHLLRRLAAEYQASAQERDLQLRVRPCGLWVRTDAAMLERILRNLLSNALRYTRSGGVLLAARVRRGEVRCEVWDTGIGIAEEHKDEVFVEFRQLDNPQRDRRHGLGLGLAIVKRLARLLNHRLEVLSRPGRGSAFFLWLPEVDRVQQSAGTVTEATPPDAGESAGLRLLVVDDDSTVLQAMESLLGGWGYRVTTAASPEEAVAAVDESQPDVLIVDFRLPHETTGTQVIEALRRRSGKAIPAVVITGDTAPDRLHEAQASGYPLLHKPVHPAKLRYTLRNLTTGR